MPKVRCSVCASEDSGRCTKKKCKVSVNKSRTCRVFAFDVNKVKVRTALPTTRVSQAAVIKDASEFKTQRREYREAQASQSAQHPLTGDLSRFTSSAAKTGDR